MSSEPSYPKPARSEEAALRANPIAIQVTALSKRFEIYNAPRDRLKQFVMPRLQRLAGQSTKQYFRDFWALNGVSFDVRRGETVGIIGRNGSGKSTLLQLICGTLSPTSGTVETGGRITALLELGSGFNAEFTGRENIYLSGAILGLSREEIDTRFDDVVAFADIGEFIEQPVKIYSSGMYLRLAFAVQSQVDPDIFIVDEALAVGDEKFQRKCFSRMEQMKQRGASILFVSHSAAQISELCDRALLLERGERLLMSSPSSVIRAYQKLIYAPVTDQLVLVQKFKSLDSTEDRSETDHAGAPDAQPSEESRLGVGKQGAYFDATLLPETTQVYPSQGAEIEELAIIDRFERTVNVLMPGDDYRLLLQGRFTADCRAVYFGFHIRSVSGVEVTGQRYPEQGKSLKFMPAGQEFSVSFSLRISLLNEWYFVGAGVWSAEGSICLHRVLDKLMFRVAQNRTNRHSFGYFDASVEAPRLTLGRGRMSNKDLVRPLRTEGT